MKQRYWAFYLTLTSACHPIGAGDQIFLQTEKNNLTGIPICPCCKIYIIRLTKHCHLTPKTMQSHSNAESEMSKTKQVNFMFY